MIPFHQIQREKEKVKEKKGEKRKEKTDRENEKGKRNHMPSYTWRLISVFISISYNQSDTTIILPIQISPLLLLLLFF